MSRNHVFRFHLPLMSILPLVAILISLAVLTFAAPGTAIAQAKANAADPNFEHPNHLITVKLEDRNISGLASHRQDAKALRYGIVLFPGYPGIIKLREEAGAIHFELRGNFLIRSRRQWLDDETLTLVVDHRLDIYRHQRRFHHRVSRGAPQSRPGATTDPDLVGVFGLAQRAWFIWRLGLGKTARPLALGSSSGRPLSLYSLSHGARIRGKKRKSAGYGAWGRAGNRRRLRSSHGARVYRCRTRNRAGDAFVD